MQKTIETVSFCIKLRFDKSLDCKVVNFCGMRVFIYFFRIRLKVIFLKNYLSKPYETKNLHNLVLLFSADSQDRSVQLLVPYGFDKKILQINGSNKWPQLKNSDYWSSQISHLLCKNCTKCKQNYEKKQDLGEHFQQFMC